MELTRAELEEWKRNPATQWVLEQLDKQATMYAQELLGGATLSKAPAIVGGTSWTVGALHGLGFINTIKTEEGETDGE